MASKTITRTFLPDGPDAWGDVHWKSRDGLLLCHASTRKIVRGLNLQKKLRVLVRTEKPKDRKGWRRYLFDGFGICSTVTARWWALNPETEDFLRDLMTQDDAPIWVRFEVLEK
jgi:hypothetical protein